MAKPWIDSGFGSIGREKHPDCILHIALDLILGRRFADGEEEAAQDAGLAEIEEVLCRDGRVGDGEASGFVLAVEIGGKPGNALAGAGFVEGLAQAREFFGGPARLTFRGD